MTLGTMAPALLLAALVLDALVGDPDWLWARAPHPVVLFGRMIGWLDRTFNRETWSFAGRRVAGVGATLMLVLVAGGVGTLLHIVARLHPALLVVDVVAAAILLAQRSLFEHVARVAEGFRTGGLAEARRAVSMIVGRDPNVLDEAGVCRAAIETTAENFSDGVVAPAFWYLVAGLPGILVYKAVNTADSMIGHRTTRHEAFGWSAARLDDVLNLLPARIAGVLVAAAAPFVGGSAGGAFGAMARDAGKHRSPNAGWPEAATAGAFGLALAGPRIYGGSTVDDAWMNARGRTEATPADIRKALRLLIVACGVQAVLVAMLAVSVL